MMRMRPEPVLPSSNFHASPTGGHLIYEIFSVHDKYRTLDLPVSSTPKPPQRLFIQK
ncbi:hypothetical protein AVEN_75226-1, partial [Araneus ventricosus]